MYRVLINVCTIFISFIYLIFYYFDTGELEKLTQMYWKTFVSHQHWSFVGKR